MVLTLEVVEEEEVVVGGEIDLRLKEMTASRSSMM